MTYSSSCHHRLHRPLLQWAPAGPGSPRKWPLKWREKYITAADDATYIELHASSASSISLALVILYKIIRSYTAHPQQVHNMHDKSTACCTASLQQIVQVEFGLYSYRGP